MIERLRDAADHARRDRVQRLRIIRAEDRDRDPPLRRSRHRIRISCSCSPPRLIGGHEFRGCRAQAIEIHPARTGDIAHREVERGKAHMLGEILVPFGTAVGCGGELRHCGLARGLEGAKRGRDVGGLGRSAAASAMASSRASRVPEPMEKCAVCRASPRSTRLPTDQWSFQILGKRRQIELFEISR